MEYIANNMNMITSNIFIRPGLLGIWGNKPLDHSWKDERALEEEFYWGGIAIMLSEVEGCQKIIKTVDRNDDMLLFISKDTSTRFVSKVMDVYSDILCSTEKMFSLLVLSEDESKSWEVEDILFSKDDEDNA